MSTIDGSAITAEGHLRVTRTFNAPRALVWKAWTDPVLFAQWWGPKQFSAPSIKMDVRPGGRFHWCMRGRDGTDIWSAGEYLVVEPIERLEYLDHFTDAEGNKVGLDHYGYEGDVGDGGSHVTVILEDLGGRTRMRMQHADLPKGMNWSEMADIGWSEAFDKLAIILR